MNGISKTHLLAMLLVLWVVIAVVHKRKEAAQDPLLASPTRFAIELEPYDSEPFLFQASEEENAILARKKLQLEEERREAERRSQRRGRSVSEAELAQNHHQLQQAPRELRISDLHYQAINEMAEAGVLGAVFSNQTKAFSSMYNPSSPDGTFDPERLKQMEEKGELFIY